ncbi:MAG: hypothetical protein ACLUEK_08850 [Oscillospiraceae bacterium]
MKIIIPVDEASVESGVCVSFGRAPYFMLCEGGKAEFLPNPGAEAEAARDKGGPGRGRQRPRRSSPSAAARTPPRCSRPRTSGSTSPRTVRRSKTLPRSRRASSGS